MENNKVVAEKIWTELVTNSYGKETGIAYIEAQLKKMLNNERENISSSIMEHAWTFDKIPFKMYWFSIWTLITRPRYFFLVYFKNIQNKLSEKVKNRVYS